MAELVPQPAIPASGSGRYGVIGGQYGQKITKVIINTRPAAPGPAADGRAALRRTVTLPRANANVRNTRSDRGRMNDRDLTAVIPRLRDVKPIRRDPWGEDDAHPPLDEASAPHPVGVLSWLLPGLLMAALGVVGVTGPALWTDELATWGMASSSWQDIFALLRWVDATIGPYYLVVRGWAELAGTSDAALRVPSIVAMTGAAALVGALGARLATRRVGVAAGLIFAILPMSSRFAQEARAYALTTFFAVLATYLLIRALGRPGFWRYLGYTLALMVTGLLHPLALLLLTAHGWVVFAQYRRQTLAWLVAAVFGALPAVPLFWLGNQQKSQVAWIPKADLNSLVRYPDELFGVAAIGITLIVLSLFSLPLRRPTALYTAWAVVPVGCLFLAAQVTPLFLPRYLLFTLPAWALLAGVALGRRHVVFTVLAIGAIAALAVPQQRVVRGPAGHDEASREMAWTIGDGFKPGDGVVYGQQDDGGSWVGRDSVAHYLPADRRPKDVLMTQPQRVGGQLAASECADPAKCLGDTQRLWIVRLGYRDDPLAGLGEKKEAPLRERYRVEKLTHLPGFTVGLVILKNG
jgi:mannosyltransferase